MYPILENAAAPGAEALAALPMYELPALRAATDPWWRGLAHHMTAAGAASLPAGLTRPTSEAGFYALWRAPNLRFAQTCGYPLTHGLRGQVRLVATPTYDCPGCDGTAYRSFLLVRADDPAAALRDLRGRVAAVNSRDSQSGYAALRASVAPVAQGRSFFAKVTETGGHRRSMEAVAAGEADLCAIDCVTHALLAAHHPRLTERLRIVGESPAAPGLPYITSVATSDDELEHLRRGLFAALADDNLAATRAALLLAGAEILPLEAYGRILQLEAEAERLGYPDVA